MAIAVVYRLLSGFVFLSFALIAPIVAASSTPGSSGLGIKAGGISGGISLRNGYASSAIIYPNGTLQHIVTLRGDADYNRSMLALTTSLDDDTERTRLSLFEKLNRYIQHLRSLILSIRDSECDTECASIGSMITQVSKPLLDQLGCDHPFKLSVPRLPSQRFQDILRDRLKRIGCSSTQQRFYSDWWNELEATNLLDRKFMCDNCEEEQRRLYLVLTHDRTATVTTFLFWEPRIGEIGRYHITKRPAGELGRQEWSAAKHELNTTLILTKKNVEQGRVWGRYDLEVGSRIVDRLFLSGKLVQQIELRVILESLLSKEVVDRAFRELHSRDLSWPLWSGAARAASFCRRSPADCQWASDDLHSEL